MIVLEPCHRPLLALRLAQDRAAVVYLQGMVAAYERAGQPALAETMRAHAAVKQERVRRQEAMIPFIPDMPA